MGDLKGHVIPGTMFLLTGMWWAVCCLRRYFICRRANRSYVSSIAFSSPCACGKMSSFPVESVAKIVLAGAGMLGELIFNMPSPSMGIVQHATMYFFFLMSGVVEMTMHHGLPIPPGADYLAVVLAFGVEGLLFANHLHGRDDLDTHLHVLLVYVIFMTVAIIALETKFQRSVVLTLARSYTTMLQGTWFWAVGIILYGHDPKTSPWANRTHENIMKSTIYFSWHCAAIFLVLFFLIVFMSCFFRDLYKCSRRSSAATGNGEITMTMLTKMESGDNGHQEEYRALTADADETDSDIEYEEPVGKQQLLSVS